MGRFLMTVAFTIAATQSALAEWKTDFEKTRREAKAAGKPMLIHFYADWCPPCRQMEATVLNTQGVKQLLASDVIGVKLNADLNSSVVRQFGVRSLPADVILEPDGRVSGMFSGATSLASFEQRLRGLVRSSKPTAARAKVANADGQARSQPSPEAPEPTLHIALKPVTGSGDLRSEKAGLVDAGKAKLSTPSDERIELGPSVSLPALEITTTQPKADITLVLRPQSTTSCLLDHAGTRVGLSGYSPVALQQMTWVKGSPQFSEIHQGTTYWFASAEEASRFKVDPETYVPGLNGIDPVALKEITSEVVGSLEFAAAYGAKTYFFSSGANRDRFVANAERYAANN